MNALQRVTAPTVEVLRALLEAGEPVWGLRIVKVTGRQAGSVYPILGRLEEAGWIAGQWEDENGRGGPRRRLYRLTAEGEVEAAQVVAAFDARRSAPAAAFLRPTANGAAS